MNVYEKSINDLIPEAEKEANQKILSLGKESEIREGVDGKQFS
jgi:hypothetical protein